MATQQTREELLKEVTHYKAESLKLGNYIRDLKKIVLGKDAYYSFDDEEFKTELIKMIDRSLRPIPHASEKAESSIESENNKLWHMVRVAMRDPQLEKDIEIETDQMGNRMPKTYLQNPFVKYPRNFNHPLC